MKNETGKKDKILFCHLFSFIMEYFSIKAKALSDCSNEGSVPEASISSWKTRNPPGSDEGFSELVVAMKEYMEKKHVADFFDRGDYIKKFVAKLRFTVKSPNFL